MHPMQLNRVASAAPLALAATEIRSRAGEASQYDPIRGVVVMLAWLVFAAVVISHAHDPRVPPSGVVPCRITQYPAALGPQAEAAMTVSSGVSCPLWGWLVVDGVHEVSIATPPQHGSLRSRDSQRVIYTSAREFKGADAFEVAVTGISQRKPRTVHLRVKVRVQ